MRNRVGAVACTTGIAVLALAACSGGGGKAHGASSAKSPACSLVTRLDDIANGVGRSDVSDPGTFKRQFATAVGQYVTTVRALRATAPSDLDSSLDRVAADVQQYRFGDALTDRADLDAYAKQACGRTVVPVVLTEPSTMPLTTTTVVPPAGATTLPSASTTVSSTTAG